MHTSSNEHIKSSIYSPKLQLALATVLEWHISIELTQFDKLVSCPKQLKEKLDIFVPLVIVTGESGPNLMEEENMWYGL